MNISQILSRFELAKLNLGEIDIKKSVDEVAFYIIEQENKIELLKKLKGMIEDKIKELDEELKMIKLQIAEKLDSKTEGIVFALGVRKSEKLIEIKPADESLYVKNYQITIEIPDRDIASEFAKEIENKYMFKTKIKEVIDKEMTKEKLIELGYLKKAEVKTLVIYNKNKKEEE